MPTDSDTPAGRIRFGEFEVDLRSHELLGSGRRIRLQEKAFLVLHQLLERPGEVVTREELVAALWPKQYFVDAEHGLNTAVRRLREALGDSADAARYVETLPRIGYRFVATIENPREPVDRLRAADWPPANAGGTPLLHPLDALVPPTSDSVSGSPSPTYPALDSPPAPERSRHRRAVAVVLVAAALALVAWLGSRSRSASPQLGAAPPASAAGTVDVVEELLARSRYLRNHKRFAEAQRFVEQALELDPRNANALAGLSLGLLGEGKLDQARETALRALEIDPDAWEAHRALGVIARSLEDMAGAEHHFRRSVEANPTDHKSRNRFARLLLECGRFEEAREQIVETRRVAPDDPDVQNIWIEYALRTGDYESAIRQGEIWTAIWEKSYPPPGVRDLVGLALVGARRHDEALEQFRALDADGELRIALALGHAGRVAEARAILDARERSAAAAGAATREVVEEAASMAMAYIALGDLDRAFRHLDRQVAARSFPGWLHCPLFDSIRRDPRWAELRPRLQQEFFAGKRSPVSPLGAAGIQSMTRRMPIFSSDL